MEADLRTFLLANAGVAALVTDRVTVANRPQGDALPALVLHRISGVRDYVMEGRSGYVESLIQMDCWAGGYLAAKALANAVLSALDGLTVAPFQGAFVVGERDSFETAPGPDTQGSESFYRTSLDVRVHHTETL